jgi:prevent-host-death family protein
MKASRIVQVHVAKTHLSRLLNEVENGGEIIVERHGKQVARIVGMAATAGPAQSYGMFANQFVMHGEFNASNDELADEFGIPQRDR